MLYPKEDEDSHKLMFTCRTCQYTEPASSSCVFRHILNNAAGETAGVTQDVGSDPTVCGPVPFDSAKVHHTTTAPAASTPDPSTDDADRALALCMRCGITLLHCGRCQDPATVAEYYDHLDHNPDISAKQTLRYIEMANLWSSLDYESQASLADRFASTGTLHIPSSVKDDRLTDYLPYEIGLDPDADPLEAIS